MKRFITVLSSLLVLPAFAEVAPVYYDDFIEYSDELNNDENIAKEEQQTEPTAKQNVVQRSNINRSGAVSRAKASTTERNNTASRAVASTRGNATSARTTTRTTKTANVVNRQRTAGATRTAVTSRNTAQPGTKSTVARVGTSDNSVMPGNRVTTRGNATTLTDSGKSLYNASGVGVSTRRSNARLSTTLTATTTPVITQEDVSATADNLNALTELTDYCKAQYATCMDNYCDVLDDNQGRCSCSKNLKNYAKTEASLAQATEEFQEVVQKIRYIGLTGEQVESLFTETEAELSMKSTTDNSRLKSSLDAIKKKIVDVSSPTSTSTSLVNGLSWDVTGLLNADFTSGFDLSSFLGMTTTNSSSVSNQRGEQLYKTAQNRCKTNVLNSCVAQGVDANVITNSYDLEIDKQCIAYERNLNEANQEMRNNVSNASNILQQARLMLAQNRNSYDLRGCVAAIDSCMQDEYVCGSDYEKCLDPTGKYLANGAIVKGGTPGVTGGQTKAPYPTDENNLADWTSNGMYNLYATWNYGANDSLNAWSIGNQENLGAYIDASFNTWDNVYKRSEDALKTTKMALYLLQKIGYIDKDDKVHGMCASVMKQCQDYAFDVKKSTRTYKPDNEVVRQYLNNTLATIKVKQDTILADYAETCRSDVQSCLATNGYDESYPNTTVSKTAVNACSAEITTCMSVSGYQVSDGVRLTLRMMSDWVAGLLINCPVNYYLVDDGIGTNTTTSTTHVAVHCEACSRPKIVVYTADCQLAQANGNLLTAEAATSSGGQVTHCTCPSGYEDVILTAAQSNIGEIGELVCLDVTNSEPNCFNQ